MATGATFNIIGANGGGGAGVLNVALGQSGTFNIAGTSTISSVISGATFGITKTGAGTLTLSGANTYTGATTVSQGTLVLNNNTAAGGFAAGTITLGNGSTGNSNVELQFGSGISGTDLTVRNAVNVRRVNPITVANTGSSGTATLGFKGFTGFIYTDLSLNRATVFASDSSTRGQRVYMGQITGAGAGAGNDTVIYDSGAGNWLTMYPKDTGAVSLANTFSGNLRVKSGNLEVSNHSYISDVAANSNLAIPDTASVTVDAGALLVFVWGDETFDALNGAGTISRNTGDGQGTRTLTIGASGG